MNYFEVQIVSDSASRREDLQACSCIIILTCPQRSPFLLWHNKLFQAHFTVTAPALESGVSKEPNSFYWRTVFGNQHTGAGCADCYWGVIASRLFQKRELVKYACMLCVYIHVHRHTSISLCICLHIYVKF